MKKIFLFLLVMATPFLLRAQNWTPMAVGLLPNDVVIFSISALGDQVVWAVASGEYYQAPIPTTHHPRVLRTGDGGQHWTVAEVEEVAGAISFQIVAVDSLTAWITTQDYGGGPGRILYKTTDGGNTWVKKHTDSGAGVALNRFPDGQHWLAHNRQTTGLSSDNGDSWVVGSITGYQTGEYQLLNSGTNMSGTVGDTLWNGTSGGRVLRLTNYGQNAEFFSTTLGTATSINSIAFHDHLNGLLSSRSINNNNRIARSVNGGATWTTLAQQPGATIGWNIAAVPGAPGFYVLASNYNYTSGKVAITTDFGNSWTVEDIFQPLNAVEFTGPATGWIGSGRITSVTQPALFKYNGSPLVATREEMPVLPGFSVSPNPATGVLQFNFDGLESAPRSTVSLTDPAGRLVWAGIVTGNRLDVGALRPGLYLLSVRTGGKVGRAKVVLE